jgi:hypothetical protein
MPAMFVVGAVVQSVAATSGWVLAWRLSAARPFGSTNAEVDSLPDKEPLSIGAVLILALLFGRTVSTLIATNLMYVGAVRMVASEGFQALFAHLPFAAEAFGVVFVAYLLETFLEGVDWTQGDELRDLVRELNPGEWQSTLTLGAFLVASLVVAATAANGSFWREAKPWVMTFLSLGTTASLTWMLSTSRLSPDADDKSASDECWRLGAVYFNPDDGAGRTLRRSRWPRSPNVARLTGRLYLASYFITVAGCLWISLSVVSY